MMPTGAGKTRGVVPILKRKLDQGLRVAFVAELEESIDDTVRALNDEGIWCGVIKAGRTADPLCRAQVCSQKTLIARPQEIPASDFVVLDECHGIAARTPVQLFTRWAPQELLGLTATPQRGDGAALDTFFKAMVCGPSVEWLQRHGLCGSCGREPEIGGATHCHDCFLTTPYLVRTRPFAPGSFQEKNPAWDAVDAYRRFLWGKKAIILSATVRRAMELAEELSRARGDFPGVPAECLHGGSDSDTRAGARERLTTAAGGFVLTGVDVFTQAWDCPAVEGIIFDRKFTTLGPWLQAWGRGMRPAPGKSEVIGVDLWGSYWLHGPPEGIPLPGGGFLPRQWNLEGKPVNGDQIIRNARCQTCGWVGPPGQPTCSLCGAQMTQPTPPAPVVQRTLYDMTSVPDAQRDEQFLMTMRGKCLKTTIPALKRKNRWHPAPGQSEEQYALAWAFRRFLEKFGREPLRG